MRDRRSWLWLLLAVGTAAVTAIVTMLMLRQSAGALPLPRGPEVAVSEHPAALEPGSALRTLNAPRGLLHETALTTDPCLDGVAAHLATAIGGGATPSASATCGPVRWGWVSGADRTGQQQAHAAVIRGSDGPSPLVDRSAHRIGLALAQRRVAGALVGYALVWVVAQ